MKIRFGLEKLLFLVAGASTFFSSLRGQECGIPTFEPTSYFDHVDYQGHVHLVIQLEKLAVGKKELPIFLIVNSGNRSDSAHSGIFQIPLLEARIEQMDENTFVLRSPTGWILPFTRHTKSAFVLEGTNGLKGLIDEQKKAVTIWAACGDKLIFSEGKLISWTLGEETLDFVYSGGNISQIRNGGTVLLQTALDPTTKRTKEILLGLDKKITLAWGKRPIVSQIGNSRAISEIRDAISSVQVNSNKPLNFKFSLDDNLNPLLDVDGIGEISWDPSTLLVKKIGQWDYSIVPASDALANAAITKSSGTTSEYWFYDSKNAVETRKKTNGETTVHKWHSSGILNGKTRSKLILQENLKIEEKYSYDEFGELRRVVTSHNGSPVLQRIWNQDKTSVEAALGAGSNPTTLFDEDNEIRGFFFPAQKPADHHNH